MPLLRPKARCLAVSVVLIGLAACSRTDAPATEAAVATDSAATATPPAAEAATPVPEAPNDANLVDATLVRLYGADAKLDGTWTSVPVDASLRVEGEAPGAVTRRVCARGPGPAPGEELLAVCGQLDAFGHGTPGLIDLYQLSAGAEVARLAVRDAGSMGNPGKVAVRTFGAETAGFDVISGFFNMGQGVSTRRLFLARGGALLDAGWMREGLHYREDCKGADCADAFALDFDLVIDDSNPRSAVFPLSVNERGSECGRKVDTNHRIVFDPERSQYVIPAALQRENCTGKQEG